MKTFEQLIWQYKTFNELTNQELYSILALREEVFEIEQSCIYQDMDFQDQNAIHIFCKDSSGDILAAYCRVFLSNSKQDKSFIGRVIVKETYRSQKLGYELMFKALEYLKSKKENKIQITAQARLKRFYKNLGFEEIGDEYYMDGMNHVDMYLLNS